MKILIIAYYEALDEELMELLATHGLEGYTKWTRVQGQGAQSGPHLMSHVWPKGNNVLMVAAEDDDAKAVLDDVRKLRKKLGHEGVKAFLLPLDAIT